MVLPCIVIVRSTNELSTLVCNRPHILVGKLKSLIVVAIVTTRRLFQLVSYILYFGLSTWCIVSVIVAFSINTNDTHEDY